MASEVGCLSVGDLLRQMGCDFSVDTPGELLHFSGSHINSCMYDIDILPVRNQDCTISEDTHVYVLVVLLSVIGRLAIPLGSGRANPVPKARNRPLIHELVEEAVVECES